ncbi:MAG: hypothetical protein J6L81_10025 [Clostridia bacterium]|nr:hypothetical protein [Clostridia bacterium]
MEEIKSFAISVCAIAVLSAIIGGLFSEERYGKIIRLVLSTVLICVLISAIPSFSSCDLFTFKEQAVEENRRLSDTVSQQTAQIAASILTDSVMSKLNENGIYAQTVEIVLDISDEGSITISKVNVISDGNKDRIIAVVTAFLGIENDIITVTGC